MLCTSCCLARSRLSGVVVAAHLRPCQMQVLSVYFISFTGAPQPPIDCSLHNESNLVEVSCSPGSDGGLPQHFLLEVRGTSQNSMLYQPPQTLQTPQSDQGSVGEVSPIYRESNPDPIFLLHDLEPGFDYTVTVYAVNGQGKSKPVQMDNVRVVEPIGEKSSRSDIFLQDLKSVLPRADSEHMIIILALVGESIHESRLLY